RTVTKNPASSSPPTSNSPAGEAFSVTTTWPPPSSTDSSTTDDSCNSGENPTASNTHSCNNMRLRKGTTMTDSARTWHPFGRTRQEDLQILANGGQTGWWD